MKTRLFLAVLVAGVAFAAGARASRPTAHRRGEARTFSVKADRIAVDNVTKAAVLTGHVEAVSEPLHLTSEMGTRDADGTMRLHDPTSITTCTNHPGICHWRLKGDVEYLDGKYIEGRNIWLEFYEIPVFWLPYFYYPLEGECALRIMPGYLERWGAYLQTKTVYNIVGDPTHADNTWWLHGNTRFDLRYVNGIALGETLYWNLGDFGKGKFKIYYAWDENYDEYQSRYYTGVGGRNWANWGSLVERDRYAIELQHTWDVTEQDTFRLRGSVVSDTHFRTDFLRDSFFNIKSEWMGSENNEIAWEHTENAFAVGTSVSGPLNKFYGGTARLPEFYVDVQPQPLFSLPVNFESENRIGYLTRQAARYGNADIDNPFAFNPGRWADYAAFRVDSYNRVTAPFRTMDDILSVVPRAAYRATGWGNSGRTNLEGWDRAGSAAPAFRSILETGTTLAARGQAWLDNEWRHTFEPYLDFLAQKAWCAGLGTDARPYVFDNLDSSRMWEDQFAGRGRNLPYSYCGITPGLRNALSDADSHGNQLTFFDFDVYTAVQFNRAEYFGENDYHKLAKNGRPNYGKTAPYLAPGFRTRWNPAEDISLLSRFEYDPDSNTMALGDVAWSQKVTSDFSYFVKYSIRDSRYWDYSSTPYDPDLMRNDDFNWAHFHHVHVGFTQQPIDWFAWSPFMRWDIKESELDSVGAWFDYLTDCLGFRLLLSYDNEYTRIDGYRRKADFGVGFYIYLRALGPDGMGFGD